MICDMKKGEMSIRIDDSNPVVILNNLKSDLIPFLGVEGNNNSLELV